MNDFVVNENGIMSATFTDIYGIGTMEGVVSNTSKDITITKWYPFNSV
jgi:hypothetical protein